MGLKPDKDMKNKYNGDTGGYFEKARTSLLKNPNQFLKQMLEYDKENMDEKVVQRVGKIINSEDFTMEKVKSASQALVAILKWSSAMLQYHELLKIVNPKRAKVAEMNAMLDVVRASLKEKRAKLAAVVAKIEGLEAMFKEKKDLEESLQQ